MGQVEHRKESKGMVRTMSEMRPKEVSTPLYRTPARRVPVDLRPMSDNERNMVLDNWVRSYGDCERPKHVESDIWYRGHRKIANDIVDDPGSTITVACYPANPGFPLGWVCIDRENRLFHYLFVRKMLRGEFGIGGKLLEQAEEAFGPGLVIATHATPSGKRIIARRDWLKYDPWALRGES